MAAVGRREHSVIAGAILAAVEDEVQRANGGSLTSIASRANIAYDRLQGYLIELSAKGLITSTRVPRLTPRGAEFLRIYREWMSTLERFGFGRAKAREGEGQWISIQKPPLS